MKAKNRVESLLTKFVSLVAISTLIINPMAVSIADSNQESKMMDALRLVATQGFFHDQEEYAQISSLVSDMNKRDLESNPLSREEIDTMLSTLKKIETSIPVWLDRMIADSKKLVRDEVVSFPAVSWDVLRKQCGDLVDSKSGTSPIGALIDGLTKMKAGIPFDWEGDLQGYSGQQRECEKQLNLVFSTVATAKAKLLEEVVELRESITLKITECESLDGEGKAECEKELSNLEDVIKVKTEKHTRIEKTESGWDPFKLILGVASIIGAFVATAYGNVVAAERLFALGGALIVTAQPHEESKEIEEERETGRKRDLDGATNPTPEQVRALEAALAQSGFQPVEFQGVEDGLQVSIFRNNDVIRIYVHVSQGQRLVAELERSNTFVLANESGLSSPLDLATIVFKGKAFGSDNILLLNFEGTLPDGTQVNGVLSERSVGSKTFQVSVEEVRYH